MLVGHVQLHQAQRVGRPGLLHDTDPAAGTLGRLVSLRCRPLRIVQHLVAEPLADHDRLGDRPRRIEDDRLDHFGELRRRGSARLADHGAISLDDLPVDRQAKHVFRHIGDEILLAKVLRQPAPAVHVGADQLDALGIGGRGEFRLQGSIIRMCRC